MGIDYIIHIRNPRMLVYFFVAYCKIYKEGSNPLLIPEQLDQDTTIYTHKEVHAFTYCINILMPQIEK